MEHWSEYAKFLEAFLSWLFYYGVKDSRGGGFGRKMVVGNVLIRFKLPVISQTTRDLRDLVH